MKEIELVEGEDWMYKLSSRYDISLDKLYVRMTKLKGNVSYITIPLTCRYTPRELAKFKFSYCKDRSSL